MSSEFQITLPGDWWYFAAIIGEDTKPYYMEEPSPINRGTRFATALGDISITGAQGQTTVTISPKSHEAMKHWRALRRKLATIAAAARELRRASIGPTVEAVLEEFERAKAAGESVTLKQLAEEAGMSYAYVRKRKSEIETERQEGNI